MTSPHPGVRRSFRQSGFLQSADVEFGHPRIPEGAASGTAQVRGRLRLQKVSDHCLCFLNAAKVSKSRSAVAARDVMCRHLGQDAAGEVYGLFEMTGEEMRGG